ncbi:MAG: radical SAM protein [Chloroflexi bacterium]|nr:radical SAM protein [Chloroflexota bacterium]
MQPQTQMLLYDPKKWMEVHSEPANSLQVFVTQRCNLRCPECFNMANLGQADMPLAEYKRIVLQYADQIGKVLISGGEPTLHPQICEMIRFNHELGKRTTIYTNGARLDRISDVPQDGLSVRVSIFGIDQGVKALRDLKPYNHLRVMFTFMLKKDNVTQLLDAARILETEYGCEELLISTCLGESYWTEYENTLALDDYPDIVNNFLAEYDGHMTLHIARRGVLDGPATPPAPNTCRFGNVLTGKLIQCPYDIERDIQTDRIEFGTVKCDKHSECLLSKIVLKPRNLN